jgi:hypothetical protein
MAKQHAAGRLDARSRLSRRQRRRADASLETLNRSLGRAVDHGRRVVEPRANELQLDLDGARAIYLHARQWFLFTKFYPPARRWRVRMRPSRTNSHAHVTIVLPRARPLSERVLLAALLGDDLKRALFNYLRALRRSKVPVAFFED